MSPFRPLQITDACIAEVNRLLDWRAAAALPDGRVVGKSGVLKRPGLQQIPDRRITLLDRAVGLTGKSVLEVGCLEGFHTLGLLHYTPRVTAIDVRPINVIKTLTRLSLHGAHAEVYVQDAETMNESFGTFDVTFHFGVLYHLMNPVEHLHAIAGLAPFLYLDTHVVEDADADKSYDACGAGYGFAWRGESGWQDVFSGVHERSRHLSRSALDRALASAGYGHRRLMQDRAERNGPLVLVLASREPICAP